VIARFFSGSGSENVTDMGLIGISRGGLDYLRAQRDLQYQETYFQLLLKQFEAAKLDEAKDAVVIQTVESAIPADRKSSPHRASIVLVFALLGFICAVSKLWVQESIQKNPAALYAWRELEGSVRRTRPSKGTDLSKQSVHG
jgi:tyrosine-protein kinase Etk/Wzc